MIASRYRCCCPTVFFGHVRMYTYSTPLNDCSAEMHVAYSFSVVANGNPVDFRTSTYLPFIIILDMGTANGTDACGHTPQDIIDNEAGQVIFFNDVKNTGLEACKSAIQDYASTLGYSGLDIIVNDLASNGYDVVAYA